MSRVGIVYPHANVDTVPSLVGAAEVFAEHGYDVDLFTFDTPGGPSVAGVSPNSGPSPGGVQLTISGSDVNIRAEITGGEAVLLKLRMKGDSLVGTYELLPMNTIPPAGPATRYPMKATVMTTGPGVIIATATASRNCRSVSQ